jgi:hypothetical protein
VRASARALACAIVLALAGTAVARAAPALDAEIGGLLAAVAGSGCSFVRNGVAADGAQAREFLEAKLAYIARKRPVPDAEAFIREVATRSDTSGIAYSVACPGRPAVASAAWFAEALAATRRAGR